MTKYQMLIKHFSDVCIKRGGVDCFQHQHVEKTIRYCEINKIKILGFDGFYLTTTTTQPSMEHSIDFSNKQGLCIQESLEYISRMPRDMYYEIVTDN